MALLRSSGLPIPKVYGYSPTLDNVAETEYIFMEFVKGIKLSDVWLDLTGNHFSLASTYSTRVEDNVNFLPSWWKLVLCTRPREGGRGRAFR
jgi:hypothetical protein